MALVYKACHLVSMIGNTSMKPSHDCHVIATQLKIGLLLIEYTGTRSSNECQGYQQKLDTS